MGLATKMVGSTRQHAAEEAALEGVARSGVQLVDLQFSDITGGAKSLTIPAGLLAQTLAHGYRFDGAALTGGVRLLELDLYLVPDPTTLAVSPVPGTGRAGEKT